MENVVTFQNTRVCPFRVPSEREVVSGVYFIDSIALIYELPAGCEVGHRACRIQNFYVRLTIKVIYRREAQV